MIPILIIMRRRQIVVIPPTSPDLPVYPDPFGSTVAGLDPFGSTVLGLNPFASTITNITADPFASTARLKGN